MMFITLLALLSVAFACQEHKPCDPAQYVTCPPPPASAQLPCPPPPICETAAANCPDWPQIECPQFEPCDASQQVTCPPPAYAEHLPCPLPPICEVAMADCPASN